MNEGMLQAIGMCLICIERDQELGFTRNLLWICLIWGFLSGDWENSEGPTRILGIITWIQSAVFCHWPLSTFGRSRRRSAVEGHPVVTVGCLEAGPQGNIREALSCPTVPPAQGCSIRTLPWALSRVLPITTSCPYLPFAVDTTRLEGSKMRSAEWAVRERSRCRSVVRGTVPSSLPFNTPLSFLWN